MGRKSKYTPGTLMQWTPKALKKYGSKISADAILVVVTYDEMYSGNRDTGHLNFLNFYKTQDCHVKKYTGPAVELWTTESDIKFEFAEDSDRERTREFCRTNNINIR